MRDRLNELFGPGGSFRVTLGRSTADEAVFADTVADTIAWEVASSLSDRSPEAGRHEVARDPIAEHEALWRHIEEELLIRRTGDDALEVELPSHSTVRRAAA